MSRVLEYIEKNVTSLLEGSEWTQEEDSGLSEEELAEWNAYRAALREMAVTYADAKSLSEIRWPSVP